MSLDVYLEGTSPTGPGSGIFIRENGATREISREEWDEKFPGREPVTFQGEPEDVFSLNITHNLGKMAGAAGIYEHLWRPEEIGITKASQLIDPLTTGLTVLRDNPDFFRKHNPPNGWGSYEGLVRFVEQYLEACRENPDATVRVWR